MRWLAGAVAVLIGLAVAMSPAHAARVVAAALTELGFDVITVENASRRELIGASGRKSALLLLRDKNGGIRFVALPLYAE